MLERVVAFSVVLALIFGAAAWLNRDGAAAEDCPDCAASDTEPLESVEPACPEGCGPAPAPAPVQAPILRFFDDEKRDGKDDEEKEDDENEDKDERDEKGGKGKRRKD